ncbi:MAG: hypothetical protein FWF59_06185 [Turicibacter sp.]|nr:hypothetical protein [Turicibacter sp.]
MNIFMRIKINLIRNKTRTIILLIISILFSLFAFSSYFLTSTTQHVVDNLRGGMPAVVTLQGEPEYFTIREDTDLSEISFENDFIMNLDEILDMPYVKGFERILDYHSVAYGWRHYGTMWGYQGGITYADSTFVTLRGVSQPQISLIESGLLNLVEGRVFLEEEMRLYEENDIAPILISYQLAEKNNLRIGDAINKNVTIFTVPYIQNEVDFESQIHEYFENYEFHFSRIPFSFVIVGKFDFPEHYNMQVEDVQRRYEILNTLIAPFWRTNEMNIVSLENNLARSEIFYDIAISLGRIWWSPYQFRDMLIGPHGIYFFLLHDINDYEAFSEAILPFVPQDISTKSFFGLMPYIYNSISIVRILSNQFLIFILGLIVLALSLIITYCLKERKKEIGIYLGLGENKSSILLMILGELSVVVFSGLLISIPILKFVSPFITKSIIRNELLQYRTEWYALIPDHG